LIVLDKKTMALASQIESISHGASLQCDVENGGPNQQAYLLVATPHLEHAKKELQLYLHAIPHNPQQPHPASFSDGRHNLTPEPTRPTEIYIPTPAVLHNLHFLQSLNNLAR
jgi:hypothetical protein